MNSHSLAPRLRPKLRLDVTTGLLPSGRRQVKKKPIFQSESGSNSSSNEVKGKKVGKKVKLKLAARGKKGWKVSDSDSDSMEENRMNPQAMVSDNWVPLKREVHMVLFMAASSNESYLRKLRFIGQNQKMLDTVVYLIEILADENKEMVHLTPIRKNDIAVSLLEGQPMTILQEAFVKLGKAERRPSNITKRVAEFFASMYGQGLFELKEGLLNLDSKSQQMLVGFFLKVLSKVAGVSKEGITAIVNQHLMENGRKFHNDHVKMILNTFGVSIID